MAARSPDALIVGGAKSAVLGITDQARKPAKFARDHLRRAILRAIIHDDDFQPGAGLAFERFKHARGRTHRFQFTTMTEMSGDSPALTSRRAL